MSDANLWTIDATPNARPRPLVTSDTSSWETAARWSPDGRRVVYERLGILSDGGQPCGPLQGPLATVNADGSDAADLTKPDVLGDADPAWSPDGQEIAFARNSISLPDTRNGIFVVDSTGGPARRITAVDRDQSDSTATGPSWSPDGSRVLYQGSDGEMRITRAAGGVGPWTPLHYGLRPSWSPDGDWIAYAHITGGVGPRVYRPRWDLRVATAAGRQERVVAAAGGPEAPVWSPDGRHVAVASPKGVVVATAARGSGRVIVHRAAAHVAWSPDGTKLAFAAWDGGRGLFQQLTPDAPGCCTTDLYVVNADGTGLRRLTHDRALITSVDWRR
jgi:Tol biopolymer transport system component